MSRYPRSLRVANRLSAMAAILLAAMLVLPVSARAELITIDFSDYAAGSDVSHVAPGLTLRSFSNTSDRFFNPIYSPAIVGPRLYGGYGIGGGDMIDYVNCLSGTPFSGFDCQSGYSVLELLFDAPTDVVEISSHWASDYPGMQVFDNRGNLLTLCMPAPGLTGACSFAVQDLGGETDGTFGYATETAMISRVVIGGYLGASTVEEIRFNRVPEPTTLGLMTFGALGTGWSHRRRRRGWSAQRRWDRP